MKSKDWSERQQWPSKMSAMVRGSTTMSVIERGRYTDGDGMHSAVSCPGDKKFSAFGVTTISVLHQRKKLTLRSNQKCFLQKSP